MLGMQQVLSAYNGWILIGIDGGGKVGGLEDFGVPFVVILLVVLLLVSSVKMAQEITNNLIGGGGEANFQKKVIARGKQMVGTAVKGPADQALKKMGANSANKVINS